MNAAQFRTTLKEIETHLDEGEAYTVNIGLKSGRIITAAAVHNPRHDVVEADVIDMPPMWIDIYSIETIELNND